MASSVRGVVMASTGVHPTKTRTSASASARPSGSEPGDEAPRGLAEAQLIFPNLRPPPHAPSAGASVPVTAGP